MHTGVFIERLWGSFEKRRSVETATLYSYSQEAGNALVTHLVFQVSMGGGHCLPSGNKCARLPACSIKKVKLSRPKCEDRVVSQANHI
uniref:SFRICE_015480 n=1 Tax=Spodoptera frugiperda TaxID=7108 RepID=A0A2H1WG49_SPOFR